VERDDGYDERDGEQSAVLSLAEIQAEARRQILAAGQDVIDEARQTIERLDAAIADNAQRLAALDEQSPS
jgi:thiamine pyrophosphate-dependent acetolactate synthase large subunit-like protein